MGPTRLIARVGAAVNAMTLGATLRMMAPFGPWWIDVAVYAAFAATGWWGVRIAERHPDDTPQQQVFRGARRIVGAGLVIVGTGSAAVFTSRPQNTGVLAFAVLLGAMLALVAVGGVALGCAAGRAVTAAGDAPDALDQLLARTALAHGASGAALWVLGNDAARGVGLFEAAATLVAAALVWRRDGARIAEIKRVRAAAIARDAPRAEAPFRAAPSAPVEAPDGSAKLVARLTARRCRVAISALVTVGVLGVGASVYFTVSERSVPEGTTGPVWVGSLGASVVRMSGASGAVCAELGDGSVWCWGTNDGRFPGYRYARRTPMELPALRGLRGVSLSRRHACAIRGDARAVCWGYGGDGRLGGSGENAPTPRAVEGLDDVTQVVTGEDFSCALRGDGSVGCWGCAALRERDPQHGCAVYRPAPPGAFAVEARGDAWRSGEAPGLARRPRRAPQPQLDGATMIAQTRDHGCAVTRDGAVVCWGANGRGQRGLGHTRPVAGPTRVPGLTGMRGVVVTGGGACAWGTAGVACWGAMGQARW